MRLYSRTNAIAVDDPKFGHFEADADGGFSLPDELADRLRAAHHRGRPLWESDIERDDRQHQDESARRRDPETLYNAVAEIANVSRQLAGLQAGPGAVSEIAALREQVEALTARLGAPDDQPPADGDAPGDDDTPPAKPSRSRKSTPATT